MKARAAAILLGLGLAGCGAPRTRYEPIGYPGELTLRYDRGFELWADGSPVARGVRYEHLAEFVRCVPLARHHAAEAERYGDAAGGLSAAGAGLALGGLGGLGGLGFYDKDPGLMAGILLTGLSMQIVGVVLASMGHSFKGFANGHAVDAMNHYNDAAGSLGGRCRGDAIELPAPPPPDPVDVISGSP